MPSTAKYYVGRLLKLGNLETENVIAAIEEPIVVQRGDFMFTFTDMTYVRDVARYPFVFGRLAKFAAEGEISVVEPELHVAMPAGVTNLLHASSPFVYVPKFSGMAYQHVWNRLQRNQFEKVFADLVVEKYDRLFVEAKVEPVANLRTFIQRISSFDTISELDARVHPPNPLFGRAWESLRDYLRRRSLAKLRIQEEAQGDAAIGTNIHRIARLVLENPSINPESISELLSPFEGGIGDAAVLMAADGYGRAKVTGRKNYQRVVVRTADNQIAFEFDKNPDPVELADEAIGVLQRINDERYLDH